jgi:hypothetical protein
MNKYLPLLAKFFALSLVVSVVGTASAQPTNFVTGDVLTNWITATANQYVRLYTNNAAKNAGVGVPSWTYTSVDGTNVSNKQPLPVYSGVQAIYSSSNWVYIRSSGMPASALGPLIAYGASVIFPTNQHSFYRFPRNATVPTKKSITAGGAIGFMVDGAIMFDIRDALVWNGSSEVMNTGTTGYWCRDAYVNEGYGFDPVGGHSAPSGGYHYHANPMALRYRLGDHMTFNATTKIYSEATNAPTQHSPIIGWVGDGFPMYGPYGYSSALDASSGIRRMVSGFVLRNGQNGTANLTLVGRTNIPPWARRIYGVSLATGPAVGSSYPLGRYLEDHDHMADLKNPNTGTNYVKGVDYDLDEYNGRFCITPEFPDGIYAYFVTVDADGTPAFPYYIGRALYGTPAGGNVQSLSETVTTNFVGAPNIAPDLTMAVNDSTVTLAWSATEGGTYRIESSTNLTTWVTNTTMPAMLTLGSYTGTTSNNPAFFRVAQTTLASYDSVISTNTGAGGGGTTITISPNSGTHGQTYSVTAAISASATPPPPPQSGAPIATFSVGSISVTGATYTYSNGTGTVSGSLSIPANATLGPQTVTITFSPPPGQQTGPSYTQQNGFTIN